MNSVLEEQILNPQRVLSCRIKCRRTCVPDIIKEMEAFANNYCSSRAGNVVVLTFSMELIDGIVMRDMEIAMPLSANVPTLRNYRYTSSYKLINALYSRHHGNTTEMKRIMQKLSDFIHENELKEVENGVYYVDVLEHSDTLDNTVFVEITPLADGDIMRKQY